MLLSLSSLQTNPFAQALHAEGPDPRHAQALQLYGRFVGSWDVDVTDYFPDGSTHAARGEWHFGWVLQGRAIQDVWITPARDTPRETLPEGYLHRYGSTLRMYEPEQNQWRITWADPAIGFYVTQVGREHDGGIVQEGRTAQGTPMRWSFRDITSDSFLWIGEVADEQGRWRLQLTMRATRKPLSQP
ncbi:MAG TPA: hypothetical protein VL997_09190 [Dyella sp.]|nr:hypothetical protein [Dyella sp.]